MIPNNSSESNRQRVKQRIQILCNALGTELTPYILVSTNWMVSGPAVQDAIPVLPMQLCAIPTLTSKLVRYEAEACTLKAEEFLWSDFGTTPRHDFTKAYGIVDVQAHRPNNKDDLVKMRASLEAAGRKLLTTHELIAACAHIGFHLESNCVFGETQFGLGYDNNSYTPAIVHSFLENPSLRLSMLRNVENSCNKDDLMLSCADRIFPKKVSD